VPAWVKPPFLYLRFCEVFDLFSCSPCNARGRRAIFRELVQGVTENEETADDGMKGREGNGGESSTTRLVSSRMLLPPSPCPYLHPQRFFLLRHSSFFMPLSICSSSPSPTACTDHGASLLNLTFLILFLLLQCNRLMREQPKQSFEEKCATKYAMDCRRLPYDPIYFSPVTS